ncbi:MAG: class I SAM-dependent methyltransferase [Rudaea sp.]
MRLLDDELGIRCVRCAASGVHLALGQVLRDLAPDLRTVDACELSARGPVANYLRRRARSVALSEYFEGSASCTMIDGVRCEDVQRLSYADAEFDLVTHTEVMEHVPDDGLAFAELRRILRPGGVMIFTVPLHDRAATLERARLGNGEIMHLEAPTYHVDPSRKHAGILAYRDYGRDILARLLRAGFGEAEVRTPETAIPWVRARSIVVARVDKRVQ